MDPVSMSFYAIICGTLSAASPKLGGFVSRFGVGIAVGAMAAWTLPVLRGTVGY